MDMQRRATETPSNGLAPEETTAMLRRILDAVERDGRKRWVEIACAVVLALATVASAWSAYQSNLWRGVQTFELATASRLGREAAKHEMEALDSRLFDAIMLIHFIERQGAGDQKLADFLHARFRPEMRTALDAWLATDPFISRDAPATPFKMRQYVQSDRLEAERLHAESAQAHEAAERANEMSNRYVMLTVLFAAVLFFGGISGTINDSRRLRWGMQAIALVLFLSISGYLFTMPLCRA
jgi:hypothetical protein